MIKNASTFDPQTELILHLGAHKTATTFIQKTLSENSELLASKRVFATQLNKFRNDYKEQKSFEEVFELDGTQPKPKSRYIISDENLIGTLFPIFSGRGFYPDALSRLGALSDWLPIAPTKILFSIRNYAHFFPSAYAEWIRPDNFISHSDELRQRIIDYDRGWRDVIRDLEVVFPHSEIVVWPYEELARRQSKVFRALTNLPPTKLVIPANKQVNPSMSWEAYEIFAYAHAKGLRAKALKSLLRQTPIDDPTPLSSKFWQYGDEAVLTARYADDLEALAPFIM